MDLLTPLLAAMLASGPMGIVAAAFFVSTGVLAYAYYKRTETLNGVIRDLSEARIADIKGMVIDYQKLSLDQVSALSRLVETLGRLGKNGQKNL